MNALQDSCAAVRTSQPMPRLPQATPVTSETRIARLEEQLREMNLLMQYMHGCIVELAVRLSVPSFGLDS